MCRILFVRYGTALEIISLYTVRNILGVHIMMINTIMADIIFPHREHASINAKETSREATKILPAKKKIPGISIIKYLDAAQ